MSFCRILLLVYIAAAALVYPTRLHGQPLPTRLHEQSVPMPLLAQSSSPSSERSPHPQAEELAKTLADTSKSYGTDSVVLQAAFLLRSIEAGAEGPTEIRVTGPSLEKPGDYLRYEVLTGLFFDSRSTTPASRLERIWSTILIPSLERLESVDIKPQGLELQLGYALQDYADNHESGADPQAPSQPLVALVRIGASTLLDFVTGDIDSAEIVTLSSSNETSSPVWGQPAH